MSVLCESSISEYTVAAEKVLVDRFGSYGKGQITPYGYIAIYDFLLSLDKESATIFIHYMNYLSIEDSATLLNVQPQHIEILAVLSLQEFTQHCQSIEEAYAVDRMAFISTFLLDIERLLRHEQEEYDLTERYDVPLCLVKIFRLLIERKNEMVISYDSN